MNMTFGQFFPGTSPVHRMDPRTKLLLTLGYIIGLFFIHTWFGYVGAVLYLAMAVFFSRVHIRFLLRALKPMLFIILVTFILNLFTFTDGSIRFSSENIAKAFAMAGRLALLVMGSQLLTLTTSPLALTDAIETMLRPLKRLRFPVHELAMMMSIALRFIPILLDEAQRIIQAQKSRGADFETGNLFRRARALVPLLVPLFVSAFRRADELAIAMEARCYRGDVGRTRMKELRFTGIDCYGLLTGLLSVAWIMLDRLVIEAFL
ncbi:MAG: energy-coupling factor transporter transmembrane component T family protein [Christensenellales bacterium]|jgi:energy-coupling factor transport system permease protein